mmetsp:Transcript_30018/g.63665  ORF Transcript_30018/g.63665 Transcript_30018/m.63665 type:complete len:213 (-) Transcript_30018:1072-1710(-)
MTPTAPLSFEMPSTNPIPSSVSFLPMNSALMVHPSRSLFQTYLAASSVASTPLFTKCEVCSATSRMSLPVPAAIFFRRSCSLSHASCFIFASYPAMSSVRPRSSHMSSVRSTGKPMDEYRKCASSPENTLLSGPRASHRFLNSTMPLSTVLEKSSSSLRMTAVMCSSLSRSSSNVSPMSSTSVLTSLAKNPSSALRFCLPYRTARRSTLLRT